MQFNDASAPARPGVVSKGQTAEGATPRARWRSHETKVVFLLGILAAIHVFVFAAGFPFFTNVDEPWHFDLIVKYSHGQVPHGIEMFSGDSSVYLGLFYTWEYILPEDQKYQPPVWTLPSDRMNPDLLNRTAGWRLIQNYEVSQSPLYYALAGLWWRAGQSLGFQGGYWLYTLRLLNILCVVSVVWLGYLAARAIFPENPFLKIGVPALLAFLPQTAFYTLGNDTLSCLGFSIVFICLLKWLSAQSPTSLLGVALGLALAATYLSKTTNLPLLAVAAAAVLIKAGQFLREGKWRATLPAVIALIGCAAPPVMAWAIWCKLHYGDFTGSKLKTQYLGWTVKPFAEWWHHPIFTPSGLWTYLSEQLGTFWQGEICWHLHPLILPGTNIIYTLLTVILLMAVVPAVVPRFSTASARQREALLLSLACFTAGLAFFAFVSIIYDFHNNPYPSRHHPYFTSGRLLLGALIPFSLLIVYGLDRLLGRMGNTLKFLTLAAMLLAMLITEIATDWPVFSDQYNWFHLP